MKKGTETISWHRAFNAFKVYSGGNKNHKSTENTQGWPKWCVVVQNSYLSSHPALTATPSFTPHPTQWIIPAPLNTVVSRIYLLFHQYFTSQLSALKLACHEILLTQRCPELRLVSVSAISALPSLANTVNIYRWKDTQILTAILWHYPGENSAYSSTCQLRGSFHILKVFSKISRKN